jgi:hypothetical protein
VGIGIGAESIRVVLVTRRGVVRRHREVPRESLDIAGLERALREGLAVIPGRRWIRRRAVAALGPHCTQVKLVAELPPLGKARDIARVLAEAPHRFFLRNGVPLTTGGVRLVDERSAWAAAFERPVVETVVQLCREARLRLDAIVPTASVLHTVLRSEAISWTDGTVRCDVAHKGLALTSVSREAVSGNTPTEPPVPDDRLSAIGQYGWCYADALGAVTIGAREPLRIGNRALRTWKTKRLSSWRRGLSYLAATTSLLLAIATPGLRAWRTELLAERELRATAAERRGVAVTARELERVSTSLGQAAEFVRHRRSHVSLLANLTSALPSDAWLMALKADSAGGHLVTLSSRAAGVLAAMDSIEGITGATFLGPVTNEVQGAREVERATIRFRWSDARCALPSPSCPNGGERR